MKNTITEPAILTQNIYFWKPSGNDGLRIKNSLKQMKIVREYLESLGMLIKHSSFFTISAIKGNIEVEFSYHESRNNVYKSFRVWKNGKRSNITTLRKMYPAIRNVQQYTPHKNTTPVGE